MRAAAVLSFVVACNGCEASPSVEAQPAPVAAPEAWTLGAARAEDLVLPPPCVGEGALAAVMPRATRIQAIEGTLDRVVAIEGTLVPTRGLPAWSPDVAGAMVMRHGLSEAEAALPWAQGARAARAGASWLVARPAEGAIALWRDGEERAIAEGEVVDFGCAGATCGLIARSGDRVRLHVGPAQDPARFREVPLPEGRRAWSIAGASAPEGALVVSLLDDLRIHFLEVDAEGARPLAALEGAAGVMAVAVSPPSAVVRAGFEAGGCRGRAGGAELVTARGTLPLRSALPAEEAAVVALGGGGLFVAWLAPVRCGAAARALHAAVIGAEGALLGPVTTVAEADGFALASDGDRVALWLEHRAAAGGRGTVTWAPMRCAKGRP